MKRITPGQHPPHYALVRANRGSYEELAGDPSIREALYMEQQGRCAYCEQRLKPPSDPDHWSRIEHFHPQRPDPDNPPNDLSTCRRSSDSPDLDDAPTAWSNLLLCCGGNERKPKRPWKTGPTHCDVLKKNRDICDTFRNPKISQMAWHVTVSPRGEVAPAPGMPAGADRVVEEILNLNHPTFVRTRGQIYGARMRLIQAEKRRPPYGLTPARRKQLVDRFLSEAETAEYPSTLRAIAMALSRS